MSPSSTITYEYIQMVCTITCLTSKIRLSAVTVSVHIYTRHLYKDDSKSGLSFYKNNFDIRNVRDEIKGWGWLCCLKAA